MAYRYHARKIGGKRIDEHRRVMQEHLGCILSADEIVHHVNGNGRDNRLANLKVMTRAEHVKEHNMFVATSEQRRERAIISLTWAKLSADMIPVIRNRLFDDEPYPAIATDYGVSARTIRAIKAEANWAWA